VDERVAERIVQYAEPLTGKHVLEIGGGEGVLTEPLLRKAKDLTVIEVDPGLAAKLAQNHPGAEVAPGDALETDLPDFDICVSNLPYSISSPVTFRLLRHGFDRAVLMYQKEFADRLLAEPGTKQYGRLTAAVNLYADVEHLENVPRTAFDPRPRVDSAVVELRTREPNYRVDDEETFLQMLKAVFTQRRKKTRNALLNTTHMTGLDEERIKNLDAEALQRRPEDLTPEELAKLCSKLYGKLSEK